MNDSIESSVSVALDPAAAFRRFFDEMEHWWPREYTWGKEVMDTIGVEPDVGGLCFERGPHGFRTDWGRILEWEPPHRVRFTWQISPHRVPVPNPENASVVEVRFTPESSSRTRVTVKHGEFERHGAEAAEYRAAMASEQGWPYLLEQFAAAG